MDITLTNFSKKYKVARFWDYFVKWKTICFLFFSFIFISWRLITLQYCSAFCHTLTWISHGFTCIPHPDPPSHLPLHPIPPGLASAPAPSTCLMHPVWAGDLFHPRYAKQKKRHRYTEQNFGLCGRRRGWKVSREQHRKHLFYYVFHYCTPNA